MLHGLFSQKNKSNPSKNTLIAAVGNTPLVKLERFSKELGFNLFAKLEIFNPCLSAKDRIAVHIIDQAEKDGKLKEGGTVIDATSGNTGLALAMICRVKGYKCVLTVADKASKEKINSLKSLGAEVVLCPAAALPDDPNSYYQKAITLTKEIPGAFYADQNFNLANSEAHFQTTGPEIWNQTNGEITHIIAAVGTGGTLSGSGRFLKTKNKNIEVIGVDAYGSVLKKYHETGIYDISITHPYKMEGVGKSIIPGNVNFDVIDRFIKVGDLKSALRARKMAQLEGVWAGHSSGAAVEAIFKNKDDFKATDNVIVVLSDHGSKYLSTIYNDNWVEEKLYSNPRV